MNDFPENTALLQRLTKATEIQAKWTKRFCYFFIPLTLFVFILPFLLQYQFREFAASLKQPLNWYDVSADIRRADLKKALSDADILLAKSPNDFEGLYKKGEILLILDDKAGALECFQKACAIFPSSKYQSAVDAVKALQNGTTPPAQ